jgi:hypothetical protein
MEQALSPARRDYQVFDPERIYGLKGNVMTQHLTYTGMLEFVPRETLDAYFKFAFTRNTWDRLVSAYCYAKPVYDRGHGGFSGWLEDACRRVREGRCHAGEHIAPQCDYLFHEGRGVLDFRGSVENLLLDWPVVCERLGLPHAPLPRLNASALRRGHYSAYFTPRLRNLVAEAYARDIELLGCRFEPA